MKTNRFLFIAVAGMLLLMTSCRDKDARMLTIINEDGTCSREMTFSSDAQSVMAPLSEPINNNGMIYRAGWQRTWSVKGDSVQHPCPMTQQQWDSLQRALPNQDISSKILMHTRQNYSSVREMGDSLIRAAQDLIKDTASLEKHFKWFYTDYVYQETLSFAVIDKLFPIPLDRYVSADTASYWFTGQPNLGEGLTGAEQKELLDNIEPRILQWFNACSMAHICEVIANEHYDKVKNPPVTKEQFVALTDSIVQRPDVGKIDFGGNLDQVVKILEDFYHSDAYTPLFMDSDIWKMRLDEKQKSYAYLVAMAPQLDYVMPGKVVDGGDGVIEGNLIRYKFSGERLIPHPYVISATSRVTNVWAFIVTFLVILLAIGSFLYRRRPKKV
ncbi:MAG: hypothetical protein J6T44_03915 [Prevotella sp.]|nr:hypothetical protein [Prevotella sp.]